VVWGSQVQGSTYAPPVDRPHLVIRYGQKNVHVRVKVTAGEDCIINLTFEYVKKLPAVLLTRVCAGSAWNGELARGEQTGRRWPEPQAYAVMTLRRDC
jgi:hypothetical protein